MVADFGLATNINVEKYLFARCGTPGFVAPEIINAKDKEKLKYSPVCDIYSVGIIFHILLLDTSPFKS